MPTKVRATGPPMSSSRREKPSAISSSERLRKPASASQVETLATFNRASRLGAIARPTAAFVDLVQLDHVAARIVHEDLRGVGADEAFDHPVLHALAVELGPRLGDVGH